MNPFLIFKSKSMLSISRPFSLDEAKKRARILLIDDELIFPLKRFVKEGYSIVQWKKVENLTALENGDYDLIILDIIDIAKEICVDDGLGLLEHIKKINPTQIVIAYSGHTFDLSKNRFWKLADDTLPKQADFVKCKEVIDELLLTKFTLTHYWEGMKTILKVNGVNPKEIGKIEKILANAVSEGKEINLSPYISAVLKNPDIVAQIATFGYKIIKHFGSIS